MGKKLEKVEVTFSDGTQETYTGNVMVIALEEDGIACRGSFKCELKEANNVAMTLVMEAGRIFKESIKQEGEEHIWTEKGDGFDFEKFLG